MFDELTVAKSEFVIFCTLQTYFWGWGILYGCAGALPRMESLKQMLTGLATSSQTARYLLIAPVVSKATWKIHQKVSDKFIPMSKYTQLFLSNAFSKVRKSTSLPVTIFFKLDEKTQNVF